jgi:hypothetical protein
MTSMRARLLASFLAIAMSWLSPRPGVADDAPTFADRSDEALEDTDVSGAFVVSPLALACGIFAGEADFVVQRSLAVAVDAGAYERAGAASGFLAVQLLVYPMRAALHGFFLGPRLGYAQHLGERLTVGASASASASVVAGWQWTWDYGLSLRLGAGAAGAMSKSTGSLSPYAPTVGVGARGEARLALIADAALGWAW